MQLAVDENLGKLALWLRVLGLDVVYIRPGTGPVRKTVLSRKRIFLTKTRRQPLPGALVIQAEDPFQQLKEAVRKLSLELDRTELFSRCLRCNTLLKTVTKEEAAGAVPEYVLATQTVFKYCPDCDKFFWPGTHRVRMTRWIEDLKREIS